MKDLSALIAELEGYGLPGVFKDHKGLWWCRVVISRDNLVSVGSLPTPEAAVRECLERVKEGE